LICSDLAHASGQKLRNTPVPELSRPNRYFPTGVPTGRPLPRRLDLKTHKKIGLDLKRIHDLLQTTYITVANTKGLRRSTAAREVNKFLKHIDELRNQLDNCVCGEYPEAENHTVTSCYYGPRQPWSDEAARSAT
jgi:hypothetical protein